MFSIAIVVSNNKIWVFCCCCFLFFFSFFFDDRTLDTIFEMQFQRILLITWSFVDTGCKHKSKHSQSQVLEVWRTKVSWQSAAQSVKEAGAGWIHYKLEEYIISKWSLSWPPISSSISLCYQETGVPAHFSGENTLFTTWHFAKENVPITTKSNLKNNSTPTYSIHVPGDVYTWAELLCHTKQWNDRTTAAKLRSLQDNSIRL